MSDLDIQIDVPDDDDLGSPVRVLGGDTIPPWLKAVAVLILGALAAVMVGAFLLGRSRGAEEPAAPTQLSSSVVDSAAVSSEAIERSQEAVDAWADFVRTGDLDTVAAAFDPEGPQYALFSDTVADPRPEDVTFSGRNLTEATDGDMTTVSMDLVVAGPDGENVYPYDFVFLGDRDRVWTVIDRRAPGNAALPPTPDAVASASQAWSLYTSSVSLGDGAGAAEVVSAESLQLAEQVAAATAGEEVPEPLLADELFDVLVRRVSQTSARNPEETLVAVLDPEQREALVIGELTMWTMVGDGRIEASLEVAGQPVAVVPFVATGDGWVFDLKGALESSGGQRE